MDNWQIGDTALCVKASEHLHGQRSHAIQPAPRAGSIHTVSEVKDFPEQFMLGLRIPGFKGFLGATMFRKIHPLSETDHRNAIIELAGDNRIPVEAS